MAAYNYGLFGDRGTVEQFIGQGCGSVQLGSEPKLPANGGSTGYQPLALLSLPAGVSLTGSLDGHAAAQAIDLLLHAACGRDDRRAVHAAQGCANWRSARA